MSANLSQVQTLFQNCLYTAFWYASTTSFSFDRQSRILFDHNLYSSDVSLGNRGFRPSGTGIISSRKLPSFKSFNPPKNCAHWNGLRSIYTIYGLRSIYIRMWEGQVLLTDGQVVFLRVFRFSSTFDERSARYKWNILEWAVKPKSKKKKKKIIKYLLWIYIKPNAAFNIATNFSLLAHVPMYQVKWSVYMTASSSVWNNSVRWKAICTK